MDETRLQLPPQGTNTLIPKRYEFRIGSKRMVIQVEPELIFGRRNPDDPDDDVTVDLTRFEAENLGVSRRHAQLLIEAGDVFLVDMGSSNGTRLNGKELKPHQPYHLRDNDEVELGRLRIAIRLLPA